MSKFGTVMDYKTGEAVREATADEWLLTARQLGRARSDGYTGAWLDEDRRVYYVEGGPDMDVTYDQVFALGMAAANAGDEQVMKLAAQAIEDTECTAWDECREVILNARIEAA